MGMKASITAVRVHARFFNSRKSWHFRILKMIACFAGAFVWLAFGGAASEGLMLAGNTAAGCSVTSTHVSCPVSGLVDGSSDGFDVSVSENAGNISSASSSFAGSISPISPPPPWPKHIRDDGTGGECNTIGAWDPVTKTCVLGQDIVPVVLWGNDQMPEQGLSVDSDGVTLDGNGHSITMVPPINGYEYAQPGVIVSAVNNVTIKNIAFNDSYIDISASSGTVIRDNNFTSNSAYGVTAISVESLQDGEIESNTFSGNLLSDYVELFSFGIEGSMRNTTIEKNIFSDYYCSLNLMATATTFFPENTIRFNSFYQDQYSLMLTSSGFIVYNNNFIQNDQDVSNTAANTFNLDAPIGGNYYDKYDQPSEGCNDVNADGFCDGYHSLGIDPPYETGYDSLPWTAPNAWCNEPGLSRALGNVYWASYEDYLVRLLSIDFEIGTVAEARNVRIVGAANTGNVALNTPVPHVVGTIAGGSAASTSLKYQIAEGVASFKTTVYATAEASCGASYSYPSPYTG